MNNLFGLFGAGGHGKETISHVQNFKQDNIKFIDDDDELININGIEVVTINNFFNFKALEKYFNVSISNGVKRKEISDKFLKQKCIPSSIIARTSLINSYSNIDQGSILSDCCYIGPNVKIGKFFHLNRYSQVSHDCKIGNFVTFAPQVSCNGHVHIHDYAYVGSGAIIKQGTRKRPLVIGEGAFIGMGAVVTKSVDAYTTVVGVPAKSMINKL